MGSTTNVIPPFPVFHDLNGTPLNNGFIYIGQEGQSAEAVPLQVYWDAAKTIPVAQPVRTINGYAARNGAAGAIYVEGNYSITVKNSSRQLVYSQLSAVDLVEASQYGVLAAEQFGVSTTNTGAQNDAAFVKAFAWLNEASYRGLTLGAGSYSITAPLPTITRSNVAFRGQSREETRLLLPATSTNSNFLRVGDGVTTVARVLVSGLRLEHDNLAGTLAGYAIILDGANDTVVEDIAVQDVAGVLDIGPTLKCSRLRLNDFRGNYQDTLNHRIGRFQRWTGLLMDDFVVYGGGTFYRTVPTFDFTTIGICDTLDWNKVTCWTRSGSQYGVFVNCDNGTFVNADFNRVILDKTGKGGGAFWFEMTGASTASAANFWKIQNITIDGRTDHGGTEDDDGGGSIPVGGRGGRSLVVRQGASTGYSAIRGITATLLSSIRDGAVIQTTHTGTDEAENINLVNCDFRDASVEADNVEAVIEMGINDFSIIGCNFVYAERPPATANIDYAIKVTNAAIDTYNIVGNKVINVTNALILHPTYTALSQNRVATGNSVIAGGTSDLALPMLAPTAIFPALSTNTASAAANVAAINAALAESVTLGNRLVKVTAPGVYPINAQINPPTGAAFSWVNDRGVIYQPIYNNTNGFLRPLAPTAEMTDCVIENLTIRPAVDPGTGNPYIGNGIVGIFRRARLLAPRIENYWGDQAYLLLPYDSVIQDAYYYTTSTSGGTGAVRILGGANSTFMNTNGHSGDDGPQLTPSKTGIYANRDIDNVVFAGGTCDSNGRPFIILVDEDLTCSITNSGFVGMRGVSGVAAWNPNAESIVVGHRGPSGVVSGILLDNITIDERGRTGLVGVGGGVKIQGAVTHSTINVHIESPDRRLATIENWPTTLRVPDNNVLRISCNDAPRAVGVNAIAHEAGTRNTIIPRIVSTATQHAINILGGDRTRIMDGGISGIPATFAGVRDSAGTNTDVSRIQFSGTGNSYNFAASPATTGRVFDCDLGGLTASGSAPTLSNNRA